MARACLHLGICSTADHFFSELVQNADDNSFAPGVTPRLRVVLQERAVCVHSNEQGFTAADVRAICDVGAGTKTADSGRIGRKGIGFKSVFMVCDSPYILSNGYSFCFGTQNTYTELIGIPETMTLRATANLVYEYGSNMCMNAIQLEYSTTL